MKEKIKVLIQHLSAYEKLRGFKKSAQMFGEDEDKKKKDKENGTAVLEGISFRYKTVQFHLIDDFFEELKKQPDAFGDLEIYAESFSLPGWGEENSDLSRDEYQFKITALIKSKTDRENYFNELTKVAAAIEEKHGLKINVDPTEKFYNINYVTFHTDQEGIFSKD